jgi:Protein of unknown function (DUF3572)
MLRTKKHAEPNAEAQSIAIEALGFLAGDPERLGRFLAVTGLGPDNLRAAAKQPDFLAQVLHYLAQDESLLLAFAANGGFPPERVARAHQLLTHDGHTADLS